jgi:hypothetical protein
MLFMAGIIAPRLAGKRGNLIAELSDGIAHCANEPDLRRRIGLGRRYELPLDRLPQILQLRFESGYTPFIFLLDIAEEQMADLLDFFVVLAPLDRRNLF